LRGDGHSATITFRGWRKGRERNGNGARFTRIQPATNNTHTLVLANGVRSECDPRKVDLSSHVTRSRGPWRCQWPAAAGEPDRTVDTALWQTGAYSPSLADAVRVVVDLVAAGDEPKARRVAELDPGLVGVALCLNATSVRRKLWWGRHLRCKCRGVSTRKVKAITEELWGAPDDRSNHGIRRFGGPTERYMACFCGSERCACGQCEAFPRSSPQAIACPLAPDEGSCGAPAMLPPDAFEFWYLILDLRISETEVTDERPLQRHV
jgi:hypothetical protein